MSLVNFAFKNIKRGIEKTQIGIIGAGTMRNGIAHGFAQNNYHVIIVDINSELLDKGLYNISKNMDRQIIKNLITKSDKENYMNIHCTVHVHLTQSFEEKELSALLLFVEQLLKRFN